MTVPSLWMVEKRSLGQLPNDCEEEVINVTLHEAIQVVLENNGNVSMTYREIADRIRNQGLWLRPCSNCVAQTT